MNIEENIVNISEGHKKRKIQQFKKIKKKLI